MSTDHTKTKMNEKSKLKKPYKHNKRLNLLTRTTPQALICP